MFHITENRGFQITFENGWTVSVQWGPFNYCENRVFGYMFKGIEPPTLRPGENYESKDAEIAAWDSSGKWFDFGGDTVNGWVSADEVADFIHKVRNLK